MDRLQELKQKGWKNLNGDERKEFQRLDAETPTVAPADTRSADDGTVTIRKDDLKAMIADEVSKATQTLQQANRSLERQAGMGNYQPYKPPKEKVYTATLRKYRSNTDEPFSLITDWKHLRFDYNELSRKHDKDIYKVKLRGMDGSEKWVEMPLEDMNLVNDFETVTILKKTNDMKQRIHGYTYKKYMDKDNYIYSDRPTAERVPLIELKDDFTCEVQLENGDKITLPESRLNG